MRLIPLALILLSVGGLNACRKPGTSGGSANLPITPLLLDLNTAPILTAAPTGTALFPDFELTDPEIIQSPLLFANTRNDDQDLYLPTILRDHAGAWRKITIPSLDHTAWVYAGASVERSELWAILDSAATTRGPGLYLLRSTDSGAIWSLVSAVRPPSILAEFTSFTINRDGKAVLTVHQDDDPSEAPRGLYAYTSTDAGETWSDPAFTPDDLVSADPPAFPTTPDTLKQIDPAAPVPTLNVPTRLPPNFRPFNNRNLRQNNLPLPARGRRG